MKRKLAAALLTRMLAGCSGSRALIQQSSIREICISDEHPCRKLGQIVEVPYFKENNEYFNNKPVYG
ncbi:hypothetical protein [Fictibacillus sp. FJAT-27399]|uniref:hypothetical protein n=1 Tax=Fictibacillus sp. FJAT-27399 TaxID=1729689 RepID=UPI0007842DC9|nr:hypothetical protein [Fictibacillus sp. FJAT-27399]